MNFFLRGSLADQLIQFFHIRRKVDAILATYSDLDFIITKNETEAMLLEADLIQQ